MCQYHELVFVPVVWHALFLYVWNGDAATRFKYVGGKLLQKVHIYCNSNKRRETCVHIGYFTDLGVLFCVFAKLFMGISGIQFPK